MYRICLEFGARHEALEVAKGRALLDRGRAGDAEIAGLFIPTGSARDVAGQVTVWRAFCPRKYVRRVEAVLGPSIRYGMPLAHDARVPSITPEGISCILVLLVLGDEGARGCFFAEAGDRPRGGHHGGEGAHGGCLLWHSKGEGTLPGTFTKFIHVFSATCCFDLRLLSLLVGDWANCCSNIAYSSLGPNG